MNLQKIKIYLILLISSNFYSISFAEPFYFHPRIIEEVKNNLAEKINIGEKIKYLEDAEYKLSLIDNKAKESVIKDIIALRKDIIKSNLRAYSVNKYLTGSQVDIIKKYKPSYLGLKNTDLTVDIHINYIKYLENNLGEQLELDENSAIYKAYLYILYAYHNKKVKNTTSTQEILNNINSFTNSSEYNQNKDYYKARFDKLLTLENFNPLSKNDFRKIYSKILKENISPESDYMKGFLYWYSAYKDILTKNTVALETNLYHTKQEYSLSCEANSIKDVINYYNLRNNKELITENGILSLLASSSGSITRDLSGSLIWADPNIEFVGDFKGKQSTNAHNFTGYGVYANPIINATQSLFSSNSLEIKKTTFNETDIIDSINGNNPVMFWYLSEVKIGKKVGYQTKPIIWKTLEGNIINGYIGEHTGVIIGFDISKDGRIEKLYFYEGKTNTIQTMDYNFAKQAAGFFNEMIVVNKVGLNSITLAYDK